MILLLRPFPFDVWLHVYDFPLRVCHRSDECCDASVIRINDNRTYFFYVCQAFGVIPKKLDDALWERKQIGRPRSRVLAAINQRKLLCAEP
ncbi:hypothetical protein VTL71DRAFT_14878 [Oculimacula yallundae]|uniref:Uncharacterized protein n=1 Tax=Oculimacula yallundae TaxID=86028 RepID=A0ABR4CG98_9HELO